jgi:RHS repeat-associated protein
MQYDGSTIKVYYDHARSYDPATGRFLQEDPLGLAAGDVNVYRYVGNSPANFIDPSGLKEYYDGGDGATAEAQNGPPGKQQPESDDCCCCCCAGAGTPAAEPENGSGLSSVPPSSQSMPANVASAETPLGPNDLLIISGNGPVTDPAEDQPAKNDKIPDFEKSAQKNGFTLSNDHPQTQEDLAAAIEKALGGGRTFNRIILLSHAGGEEDGPSADLGGYSYAPLDGPLIHIPDRMTANYISPRLIKAIRKALGPNGVFILGTCGYYCEDPPENGAKPYRTRDDSNKADQRAQSEWKKNLKKIAKVLGRAVFADPCDSIPSADPKDAGTKRILTNPVWDPETKTWIPPGRQKNKPRIGADPDGNLLP